MSDYPDAAKHEWWNKARNSQLDRLRKTEAERDRLRAEVERLTTHSGALESALFAKTSELYPDLRSELDRLRTENAELEALSAERLMLLQTRNGNYRNLELNFDKLSAKTKAELDRLRAEKAELWNTAIEECAQLIQEDFDRPDMAEAIRGLAKTVNETEGK